MNKSFLTLLMSFFLAFQGYADTWQDKWNDSLILLEKGAFEEAKLPLNEAISLLEETQDESHPYVYIDRARLHLLLGNDLEVEKDLNHAFTSNQLSGKEKLRALVTKIILNGRFQRFETLSEDLFLFSTMVDMPSFEKVGTKLIFRDIPESEYYKKLISCYLVHTGQCYDIEEIQFFKPNRMIGNTHCGCQKCIGEYAKTRICDGCLGVVSPTKENISIEGLVVALLNYVAKNVHQLEDQIACLKALCQVQATDLSIELFSETFDQIFHDIDHLKSAHFD